MSKDLAQRVITIKLQRPHYEGDWEGETLRYLEEQRWAILGDLIARLQHDSPSLDEHTRWGMWEAAVLARVQDPPACQRLIRERQEEIDDDEEDKHLVRDALVEDLRLKGVDPDREKILLPSKRLATIVNEALKEARPVNKVSAFVKTLGISELRRSNRSEARGWVWCGSLADRGCSARSIS